MFRRIAQTPTAALAIVAALAVTSLIAAAPRNHLSEIEGRTTQAVQSERSEQTPRARGQAMRFLAKADDREDSKEQGEASRREAELQELRELHFELVAESQGLKAAGDEDALAEVRRQLENIAREIAELEGRVDKDQGESPRELDRIRREITEFFESQRGEHHDPDQHSDMDEHHAHDEHHEHHDHDGPHEEGEGIDLPQRIHHLHQAAENLERAGFVEMARDACHQAEQLQRELERRHAARNPEQMIWEIHEMLRGLHHELGQLREEVRDLRERLDD